MPQATSETARRWLIGGRVQGVGFRPFVYTLARELGLTGSVRNQGGRVEIVTASASGLTDQFLRRLLSEHPPIARPELISEEPCEPPTALNFRILQSETTGRTDDLESVLLSDQSVCDVCLAEMADPSDRRYRYPFIACTQCGPRYTIMESMPFDRVRTAMVNFPLCVPCREEYEQPVDRRFHAQVMSCAACGPSLRFVSGAETVLGNEPALARAVASLHAGATLAVKGIGGYHLFCDAGNEAAVCRLRTRKQRPTKPLAVMFSRVGRDGLDGVRLHCAPGDVEAHSLRMPERPIVLVRLRGGTGLSRALAPGLSVIGAFLPYSPLHALILDGFGAPLVATSGNISGEPILTDPLEAEQRLSSVADIFLHHDRPILHPADDGVVKVIAGLARPLRLGRGRTPLAWSLKHAVVRPALALGGQTNVTLALGFGTRVVISPHLGETGSPRGLERLEILAASFQRLHGVRAERLVCDAHSGFTSTRWAESKGETTVVRVQHHHAHAAAVAGEFSHEPRWLCFTWDGVGLGDDGSLWGGEALLGRPGSWTRVATFRPFAPPGSDKAGRDPWRSAAALAWDLGLDWSPPGIDVSLAHAAWRERLNCPATSSVGRLFDAAAAFLQLVQQARHEAEGPMAVESIATSAAGSVGLPLALRVDGVLQADWEPLVPLLLDARISRGDRAAAFQISLAKSLVTQAIAVRRTYGDFAVGLSGGVFQNRRLTETALHGLQEAGFQAYLPIKVPTNDAGLSFGQIVEAAARP